MAKTRHYAILGTGALGGFYGARLQRAGLEVHFLLHRDYEVVRQKGLVVDSIEGNFTLPQVHAYAEVTQIPPCEVVVIALKTTQNHLLPQLLPSVVQPHGIVLVLQNGWGCEATVAEILGDLPVSVIGGSCFLCANKVGPGHIHHLDYGKIALGAYGADYGPMGVTEPMRAIAADFALAGIPIDLAEHLAIVRWQKLVWNIPFNGLSVVLNARTDELMGTIATRTLAESLMQEVALGAAAVIPHAPDQPPISPGFVQGMLEHTLKMKPYLTSMKLDYDHHRPLELAAIFGNPLQSATQAGVALPQIMALYQQLEFLDRRNRHP